MPEAPTKEGQNLIVANLNKIVMLIISLAIAGLFAWGNNLSKSQSTYQTQIQQLNDRLESMQKEMNGNEGDISDLQSQTEASKDDLKSRIIHLEDWQLFHNTKK